jgi:peptidoglycan/xylan/chitin deacetylase (PgdA/CDA1 family)
MKITLTIDNGPTPGVTERVLDVLAEEGVHATFFTLGSALAVPGARQIAVRARSEGHILGNHTYNHTVIAAEGADQSRMIGEIESTGSLLNGLMDRPIFRPVGGGALGPHLMSRTVYRYLHDKKYTIALWNSVPRDWDNPTGWPEVALAEARSHDWAVTVVHDLPTGAMNALGTFVRMIQDAGGQFVLEFPRDTTPMVDGVELWSMKPYMTDI